MKETIIPDGFRQNAKGDLVAVGNIKPLDLLRDEMTKGIVKEGIRSAKFLAEYKTAALHEIAEFVELAAMDYGVEVGGSKGNVTMVSFDGRFKVLRANADNITFDEQLIAAKALIDECLTDWTKDSSDNIKTIIRKAFETNKAGEISTSRVLGLRTLEITDAKWQRAMDAIGNAVKVTGSKTYLRIYERDDAGDYNQIALG